jgi:hypothetical protein
MWKKRIGPSVIYIISIDFLPLASMAAGEDPGAAVRQHASVLREEVLALALARPPRSWLASTGQPPDAFCDEKTTAARSIDAIARTGVAGTASGPTLVPGLVSQSRDVTRSGPGKADPT